MFFRVPGCPFPRWSGAKQPECSNLLDNRRVPGPPPTTRYASSGDIQIAYQVNGEGPLDLVWAPGTVSHLDLGWESPLGRFYEELGGFCRLIRFDKRGTGLSDRPT